MVQGMLDFTPGVVSEVAVVGGTGAYGGARGYATWELVGEGGTFVSAFEILFSAN